MSDENTLIHVRLHDARTKLLAKWLAEGEDMDLTQWINSLVQERIEMLTTEDLAAFENSRRAAVRAAERSRGHVAAKKAARKR